MPNYNEHGRIHNNHNNDNDSSSNSSFSEIEEELDEEEEGDDEKENSPEDCRSTGCGPRRRVRWLWGKVLDPKSKWVQEWNRIFLLVSAAGLFVDPLFFYALSVSENCLCLFVDGWFALTVTVLRCMTDALHLWNMWLQFKMNRRRPPGGEGVGATARGVAWKYFKSRKGFFFDLFVILPLPQMVMWVAIPELLEKGSTTEVMTVLLIMFIFQYLPKIYHSVCLLRRMQYLSGYIFGTVWWGIALNMIAYFVASHEMVAGKVKTAMGFHKLPARTKPKPDASLKPPSLSASSSGKQQKGQKGSAAGFTRSFGVYFPRASAQVQPHPSDVTDFLRLVEELRERESRLKTELLEHKLLKESVAILPVLESEISSKNLEIQRSRKTIERLEAENERLRHENEFLHMAVGACWYLLGIQRAARCLKEQCMITNGCNQRMTACQESIYFGTSDLIRQGTRFMWGENKNARSKCLENFDNFDYGAYKWTVQLITNNNRLEKILFPIFWGLMTLSTFGNLESTTDWLEVIFIIIVLTTGLLLVTMLIGNIKLGWVMLQMYKFEMDRDYFVRPKRSEARVIGLTQAHLCGVLTRDNIEETGDAIEDEEYRMVDEKTTSADVVQTESSELREAALGSDARGRRVRDDTKSARGAKEGYQVPLFQHMDNLVLENICDRVKSLIFTKGETITREGDPVQRMLFIVRGHLQSSQVLRDGLKSCCMLGPGNFSGDELLSWCLRRPFIERLPPSSSTLTTLETTEAFGLEAEDVKYVTQHFRYTFVNEKVKRSARYYSPGWRTWAAVAIQLAWRRYRHRLTLTSLSFIRPRRPLSRCSSLREDRLRLYTALLTSPKPNQDDFDF
ncbi:hypothetical protein OROGR_015373 [Orobanche gracilis]